MTMTMTSAPWVSLVQAFAFSACSPSVYRRWTATRWCVRRIYGFTGSTSYRISYMRCARMSSVECTLTWTAQEGHFEAIKQEESLVVIPSGQRARCLHFIEAFEKVITFPFEKRHPHIKTKHVNDVTIACYRNARPRTHILSTCTNTFHTCFKFNWCQTQWHTTKLQKGQSIDRFTISWHKCLCAEVLEELSLCHTGNNTVVCQHAFLAVLQRHSSVLAVNFKGRIKLQRLHRHTLDCSL